MKIIKKISLIITGIILSLIILEICLQLAGFTVIAMKKYKNKIAKDPNTITILCLGESTTYRSWPPILKKILNKKSKNKKFKVVDGGIPAINTRIIAEKINDDLIKYNPDIVVTMMGINDNGLGYKKYKLRTLSLFSLIYTHIQTLFYYTEEDVEYLSNSIGILPKYKFLNKMSRLYNKTGIADYHFIQILSQYLKKNNYDNKNAKKIMEHLIDNKNSFNMMDLISIIEYLKDYKNYNKEQIRNFIIENKKRIEYLQISTEKLLQEYDLLYLLNDIKDNEFEYHYKNIKKSKNLKKENTKKNYQYIISEIYKNNKNALVLPMQYPTLSMETLKRDLQDSPYYDKLIFISNEENFEKALQNHKVEEIFNDMFGGSFGHCTEFGDTLIAENVAETILKLYN